VDDEAMERFYRAGGGFRWCRPRLHVYRHAVSTRLGVGLNRYPYNVIGAFLVVGPWCAGVTWKGTR
jgi:hypothetical protein